MNIRSTLFTLAIITGLLSGSIQAHGGKPCTPACSGNPLTPAMNVILPIAPLNSASPTPSGFFTTPQGMILAVVVLGPVITWWNQVGCEYIKELKKKYWDKKPQTKAHDHSVCMDHGCEAH